MSGILEIAPTGTPDGLPRLTRAAKNRSIATPTARLGKVRDARERRLGQRMFSKATDFFHGLADTLRTDPARGHVHEFEQDRAIAEQDSDIAAFAFIARISPVLGAVHAAVREETAMSPTPTQAAAMQVVIAVQAHGGAGARAAWWRFLPRWLSRLRRALHAPVVPVADGILEVAGGRPMQWAFAPQAREFAVSRRRQSGGRTGTARVRRP